ncbi:MAG: hypothetical protein U5O39_05625 [Gammaproteobacteria bacterium]|nr:hypothetical protein [Gammaproteobacteria bacterium]
MSDSLLCVAGASGLVGANITRAALERGYRVNGALRNADDPAKAPHLKALPGGDRLTLFSARDGLIPATSKMVWAEPMVFLIATLIPPMRARRHAGP